MGAANVEAGQQVILDDAVAAVFVGGTKMAAAVGGWAVKRCRCVRMLCGGGTMGAGEVQGTLSAAQVQDKGSWRHSQHQRS